MPRHRFSPCVLLIAGLILDCGPEPPMRAPAPLAPKVTPQPDASTSQPDATAAADGRVGSACTAAERFTRGTCAADLLCAPTPGGYCVSFCPCSGDAVCMPTIRAGELCVKPCTSNAECRADEGYVCDPQYGGCVFPRLGASPKLANCGSPALPRRSFGPVTQLSTNATPGTYQYEPSAALNARGDLVVLYTAGSPLGTMHPLANSVIFSDGHVERDRPFASNRHNHFDSWLGSSRNGTLYAVWLGFDSPSWPEQRAIIGFSSSADGSTWSAPAVADDAESDCPNERPGCLDKPVILAGPDHRDHKRDVLYVFYLNEPDRGTRVVRSTDGGKTFAKSVSVTPSDDMYNATITESGIVHVVYRADNPGRFEYVRSSDGATTFTAPHVVNAPDEAAGAGGPSNPQVVADEKRGVVYVVYPVGTEARVDIVLATSTDGGASWSRTKVNDDASCANHMMPMAKLDPQTGKVHVIWLENRTGRGGVAYTSCARSTSPLGVACAPNEAVNDTPFAAYLLTRHSPKWLGDYGSLVLDGKRRVLHAVWTQTVPEASGATARIFHAAAKL